MKRRILCWLNLHRWERVGITKPIREVSDFVEREYLGHMAMGECKDCGTHRLKLVTGYWRWSHDDEITATTYRELFSSGKYKLDEVVGG